MPDPNEPEPVSRAAIAALIAITVVAAAVRLYRLSAPSLWMDEVFTADLCRLAPGRLIDFLAHRDVHPPLFFLLERLATAGGVDEWHLRVVPLIASVATVPMVFALGRELVGARAGLFAAALAAVTPVMVWYGREARSNSLFVLLAVTATWAFVVALRRGRARDFAAYALALAAGLYTHHLTVLLVAAHLAIVAIRRLADGLDRRAMIGWAIAVGGAAAIAAPWWLFARPDIARFGWVPPARPADALELARFAWFGDAGWAARDAFAGVDGVVAIVSLVIVAIVAGRPGRRDRIRLAIIAALIAIPIAAGFALSWLWRPMMVPRFYLAFLVPLYLVVGYGLARRSWLVAAAVAALLAWQLAPATWWIISGTTNADMRGAAARLRAELHPGDAVLVAPLWEGAYSYYAGTGAGVDPALPVGGDSLDPPTLCRLAALHPRVWLVWSDRDATAIAAHTRLTTAWPERANTPIDGPIHGGYRISRYEPRTDTCPAPIAAAPGPRCAIAFRLAGNRDAHTVWVSGDFTAWAPHPALGAIPLARGPDGWAATADLPAGTHQYKLIVDGTTWITDPANAATATTADGAVNSVLTCTPPP